MKSLLYLTSSLISSDVSLCKDLERNLNLDILNATILNKSVTLHLQKPMFGASSKLHN